MLLYCKDDRVIATHDEAQGVPASAYGEGVTTMPAPAGYVLIPGETDDVPELDADGLVAYAAAKRRAVIGAGCVVTVAGVDLPTWADDRTMSAILGHVLATQMTPGYGISWKARDGQFYGLDGSDIVALHTGVLAFRNAAFAAEELAHSGIDAGSISSATEIDALAWPSND